MGTVKKQKQRVVRVFFSSPFGGLEEEREELTKKYWPQLAHLCLKAGYEFVPVDMRWGITTELSSQAATIAICLRELDRSDMIVGFFGQRYGWHGDKDEFLQRTFNFALPLYPWIDKYRDRAVTELEFLHGHLNNPGGRPACFFFRDKVYDDKCLAEAEALGDNGIARKFKATTDGPNAEKFLDDLKNRVKQTEPKCLAVDMCYATPAEGAKLMFDTVYKHIKENILASATEFKELSLYEQQRGQHEAYLVSRLGMGGEYIGGQEYLDTIDACVLNKMSGTFTGKQLLVCGDAGSGKSCLLSNWLLQYKDHHSSDIVAYFFIGSATGTTDEKSILQHLCLTLENECPSMTSDLLEKDAKQTSKAEGLDDVKELKRYLEELMMKTDKMDKQVVIVIDGLDKMETKNKTAQPLYWFPKQIPSNICLIVSTVPIDKPTIDELTNRGFEQMMLSNLSTENRKAIAESMLMVRGKELSPMQNEKVVGHSESGNPLFLMILLKELCSFGDFFQLDGFIDSLLQTKSTIELFGKVLERLEKDYNPKDRLTNVIEEIMCSLLEARQGLSELELKKILHISDQVWSTLYFAVDDFLVESAGIYRLAYVELAEAVKLKYYKTDENKKRHYQDLLVTYWYNAFQQYSQHFKAKISPRVQNELPWLLEKIGDKKKLIICLTSLPMFNSLYNSKKYELISYWNATKESGESIMKKYLSVLDDQVTIIYNEAIQQGAGPWPNPASQLLQTSLNMTELLEDAGHFLIREPMILRTIKMFDATFKKEQVQKDPTVAEKYSELHNTLACQYASMERFEEAEKIHKELLEIKEKFGSGLDKCDSLKAVTLNNLGFIQTKQNKHEEAVDYYQRCLDLHISVHGKTHCLVADTMNNLAQTYFKLGQYDKAISMFEEALEIYEEVYFGILPPDVGGTVLNLAMCKIRTPDLDIKTVEPLYQKALDICVNAVGRDHPAVAQTLTSFGSFLMRLKEYDRSMEMFKDALTISEAANGLESQETLMILENIALIYLIEEKLDEAHPYYKKAGDILHKQGRMDMSLSSLNKCMVDYYLNSGRHDDAIGALLRIVGTSFASDRDFAALDFLISQLPEKKRPKIVDECSVVAGIKKFPTSTMLLGRVMEALCDSGDGDAMVEVLQAGDFGGSSYNEAYAKFMQSGKREAAQPIILAAAEKYPGDGVILENAAKCHAMRQRYPEAIALIKKALDVNTDDLALMELGGRLMAMGGQLEEAKQLIQKALEKTTEQDQELATKLKNNLQLVEKALTEQKDTP